MAHVRRVGERDRIPLLRQLIVRHAAVGEPHVGEGAIVAVPRLHVPIQAHLGSLGSQAAECVACLDAVGELRGLGSINDGSGSGSGGPYSAGLT